ncbi:MAG: hypothetical protein Q7U77_14595 [Sediminibacterium sp.]|uniref:hypothetical protein n=1 Tax=Sediminibacterium sp. TaxID=1917865 RepID=UPI00271D586C|nr:hypothetical protein [Sediminibacterium sp.]MDO8997852.1 hypothetical protein [Sediminibacterium sp.]
MQKINLKINYRHLLIILNICISNFVYCQKNSLSKINAYQFINEYPKDFNKKSISESAADTIYQYFSGDIRLVEFSKVYAYTLNEKLAFEEKRNLFLIYHKDSSRGIFLNFYTSQPQSIVNVDSLLRDSWIHNFELSGLIPDSNPIFNEEKHSPNILREISYQFKPSKVKNTIAKVNIRVDSSRNLYLARLSSKWDQEFNGKVIEIKLSFEESSQNGNPINYSINFRLNSTDQISPKIETLFEYYSSINTPNKPLKFISNFLP